jgi:transposase
MRGSDERTGELFSYIDLEKRVRADHPLRPIKALVNEALARLEGDLSALYAPIGRPSVPPEKLLRATLLQAFYSIRSERQLMERLEYDLLFRWFVGIGVDEAAWDHSSFSTNRDRLLDGDIAARFLAAVLSQPRVKRLLSSDHFSVDGTLVDACLMQADGHAERVAALHMIEPHADRPRPITLGADKGYDIEDFVNELRSMNVTPHVAQNTTNRRSAIDGRTARHGGYKVSQRIRKRIEEAFGWIKTVALQDKTRFRGVERAGLAFTFAAAAYNLIRLPKLLAEAG